MSKRKDKLDCQYEGDSFVQGIIGGLSYAVVFGLLLVLIGMIVGAFLGQSPLLLKGWGA